MTFPLDHDGFLRRECPHCLAQFKWHHGPANAEAESQAAPDSYYCPLCGQPATHDSWLTQEQVDYARGMVIPSALREVGEQLKGFESAGDLFRIEVRTDISIPEAPMPLTEPDDMTIVASPCHGYEPVKVPEQRNGPFFCLVCGSAFAT